VVFAFIRLRRSRVDGAVDIESGVSATVDGLSDAGHHTPQHLVILERAPCSQ